MVTFCSTVASIVAKTQIDYILLRKDNKRLSKDCKVISSENLTNQHKLLAMVLKIKGKKEEEGCG